MCPVSVPWKEDQSCTQCFASEHCGGGGERDRERGRLIFNGLANIPDLEYSKSTFN